jgi:ribitol 2-dehydrogenase
LDKVVLITGASSGIGEATARALVNAGAKVVAFARSADKLEGLQRELGENCLALAGDVTSQTDLDQAVAQAMDRFGRIDAAFVNAGAFAEGSLAEPDPDEWAKLVDVNIMGVLRTVHAVLPQMIERGQGDIMLTGSIAGRVVYPGSTVYAATKHAVYAIAEGLRKEVFEKGIRVGVISPGMVANSIWGFTDPAASRAEAERGTALLSEDVADAVVHALSLPAHVNIADLLILPTRSDVPSW